MDKFHLNFTSNVYGLIVVFGHIVDSFKRINFFRCTNQYCHFYTKIYFFKLVHYMNNYPNRNHCIHYSIILCL